MWDLQRNGGSLGATTERILSRGRLDMVGRFVVVAARLCLMWLIRGGESGEARADIMVGFFLLATAIFSAAYHTGWRDAHDCEYESRTDEIGAH